MNHFDNDQNLLNAIPGGIAVYRSLSKEQTELIYFNDKLCELTGYTRKELQSLAPDKICLAIEEDIPAVNLAIHQAMKTGHRASVPYRTITKNGELKTLQLSASIVSNDGKIEYSYVIYMDITEQENQKKALQLQNEEISRINNTIPGGIVRCKKVPGWPVIYANDGFYRFLGYSRAEFAAQFQNKIDGVLFTEDIISIQHEILSSFSSGNNLKNQRRVKCKNNMVKWIEVQAQQLKDSDGGESFYCVFVDITDQKNAEEALHISEEKFKIATENSDVSFWTYDYARHAIIQTNFSKLRHGFDLVVENVPESLIEKGYIRKDSVKGFLEMYQKLANGASTACGDFWTWNEDTKQWWCEHIDYTNVFDENGYPIRAYAIGKDVTKEIQQQIDRKKLDVALSNSNLFVWEYDIIGKRSIQQPNAMSQFAMDAIIENAPQAIIDSGLIAPQSIKNYRALHDRIASGEKNATEDICFINANGNERWERCTYTTVFLDGKPVSAIGCAVDINAAMEMEKKYKEEFSCIEAVQSENLLLKARANLSQDVVESYVGKDELSVCEVGAHYSVWTQQLVQAGFTEKDREMILRSLNRERILNAYFQGNTAFTIDYRRKAKDGSVFWVNTTVKCYRNPKNGDVMSFMYTYDINDAKIKEGMIETVATLEHDYIAYIDLNRDQYKIYMNFEKANFLPSLQAETYWETMRNVIHSIVVKEDIDRILYVTQPENIRENLAKQKIYSTVYSVEINHQLRKKRLQYSYLDEASGQVVLTRTDVTDLLQQQLQQQSMLEAALLAAEQANSAKSDFLSRMSHEIRTPMNAIIGMSAIAAQSIGDDEQVADCIGKIGISSRFLLSLINDILDMSRIESGKMLLKNEKIPFEEFLNGVNSICATQANAKDIDYENVVDSNIEDYYVGDAMKLQQVIINIISNAIKFTPPCGKVTFSVHQMKKDKNCATVRFVINDTGCGISEEFFSHLFEPFAQEHSGTTSMYGGTGLGLAICKNIVDMMDGHINVRSIVGTGSEFTVDVKLGITEESRTRYLTKPHYNFAQLKALVVDDDVTVCQQAVITLKEIGMSSEWVDSGKKAVDRVKEKWENKQYYDFVLVDWKMPEMDGIETARRIRKIVGPEVTIIIMTAYDWTNIEHEAKLAGVNLLMSKPMFKSSLISAFEKALGKQAQEATILTADFRFDGKRILLAEDHPLNVEVAKRLLESRGFLVEHAENGLRALEMFTISPVGYYDAILMDIRMPQMDGLQSANAIRHLTKKTAKTIPIIAMTANAFEEDIQKSKAAGMNAHLAKPIEPLQMYQTLYDFIYGKNK